MAAINACTLPTIATRFGKIRATSGRLAVHRPATVPKRTSLAASADAEVLSESQQDFTLERVCGMNRNMIQHIFDEVDQNGNGLLELEELVFLGQFLGEQWDSEKQKQVMAEVDEDGSGEIDSEEFFKWFSENCSADSADNGVITMREERVNLAANEVPQEMLDLLKEYGTDQIKQECTHPLHSGHGRMLRDHLVSTYYLLKTWGSPEWVCNAGMFHAIYERADGARACDFNEARPVFQKLLGEQTEELMYFFPSAHKSIYFEEGLLHSPLGEDFEIIDFATKEPIMFPDRLRKPMAELEFINGYDQSFLCDTDPVTNMWAYYQHATILPLLSKEAQRIVLRYRTLGKDAKVADIVKYHEDRYTDIGKSIEDDPKWARHIKMFREGGKYDLLEKRLDAILAEVDESGDGELQFEEMDKLGEALGENWSEEEKRNIFNELDKSGDGNVDREEFELWFLPKFNEKFGSMA